jgi:hypothetical protein
MRLACQFDYPFGIQPSSPLDKLVFPLFHRSIAITNDQGRPLNPNSNSNPQQSLPSPTGQYNKPRFSLILALEYSFKRVLLVISELRERFELDVEGKWFGDILVLVHIVGVIAVLENDWNFMLV